MYYVLIMLMHGALVMNLFNKVCISSCPIHHTRYDDDDDIIETPPNLVDKGYTGDVIITGPTEQPQQPQPTLQQPQPSQPQQQPQSPADQFDDELLVSHFTLISSQPCLTTIT
jgi:hypothetical protein